MANHSDEKPLQHRLHDLTHEVMDEVDAANDHLEHAYEALLGFVGQVVGQQPGWAEILHQKAGKLQAAADILVATAEELHDPETWQLPAFGDEPSMGRA